MVTEIIFFYFLIFFFRCHYGIPTTTIFIWLVNVKVYITILGEETTVERACVDFCSFFHLCVCWCVCACVCVEIGEFWREKKGVGRGYHALGLFIMSEVCLSSMYIHSLSHSNFHCLLVFCFFLFISMSILFNMIVLLFDTDYLFFFCYSMIEGANNE